MGRVISNYEQVKRLPGYEGNPTGISPLLVTQQSATSGGLWGVMDGGMIDFLGDTAYLFGGWAGAPTNPDWPSGTVTNLVYKTDDFGVTWAKIRDHDLTPDATHFGPCHYGAHCIHNVGGTDYIYLIGGDPSGTGEYVHSDTRRTTDGITWTKMNSGNALWHGLNWGRAFSLGGNLYLIGGHDSPGGVPDLEPATAQNFVFRSTDNGVTWTSLGNAPWAVRIGPERIPVWQGKAWLVGGGAYANDVNDRTFYNDVWTFDGSTWTEVLANGLAPWPARSFANVEVFDDWLYLIRGADVAGNRSDSWRSRDGITWMEVDLGPYFIPSHADGMATHATGMIQASGNGRFTNEVNSNSPTFFITSPAKPLADGVVDIVTDYVESNVPQYNGIITEGYTESTNPRVLTPGDNAKLTEISGKHYHDTEEDVFIVGMYSYGAGNVCYIGGGMTPTKNALTQMLVVLAANDATLATAAGAKTAVDLSSTKAQVQYNTVTIGCNEAAVYGPRTANTAKFGELAGVTYADNGTTLGFTGLGVYSYGANNHAVIIGGGSSSYGATLVQTYIAPNGSTVSGTLVNQTDINGTALGGKLSVGKNTTGTVFTIDAVGLYFLIGGDEASGTGHARTDSLNKLVLLAMPNYTGGDIALMQGYSISGQNIIDWGGGNAAYRAATTHRFWATATPTSGYGTEVMSIGVNGVDIKGNLTTRPAASVTPTNNGDVVFELASNTQLGMNAKGSDGTVRNFRFPMIKRANSIVTLGDVVMPGGTSGNLVLIGDAAIQASATAITDSVFIGSQTGGAVLTGNGNVAVGNLTLASITATSHNVAIGDAAARYLLTGASGNTVVGYVAATEMTGGSENVIIGTYAAAYATDGDRNVMIGALAGANSVAVGETFGDYNIALGYTAQQYATGSRNVGIGTEAFYEVRGTDNVAIGEGAGKVLTHVNGVDNVFIGRHAGSGAGVQKVDAVNTVCIGADTNSTENNSVTIGNNLITKTLLRGDLTCGSINIASDWINTPGPTNGAFWRGSGNLNITSDTNSISFLSNTNGLYTARLYNDGRFLWNPPASAAPDDNGQVCLEFTSNTTITLKGKGSDGTVRSIAFTIA